jgi:hypothetical protein
MSLETNGELHAARVLEALLPLRPGTSNLELRIRSVPISVGNAVETGKYEPGLDLAFKISPIFGKNVEEVFLYEESETSSGRK